MQCDLYSRQFKVKVRGFLPMAAILLALAVPAVGQLTDKRAGRSSSASSAVKYEISATLTYYCAVERSLPLHQLVFDFHNASCQSRSQAAERKTPTLPNGPLYRDVHLAGYHLVDWNAGHSSPNTRNTANVEISKTATTLSAAGWLGPASCGKGPSGDVVEDTFWQARVVPEVRFIEDVEHQEEPVTIDLVPPKTTAILPLSAACADAREETLQYSVTSIVSGVAAASTYTSPVLRASQAGIESDGILGEASIRSRWNLQTSGGKSELSLTIVQSGARAENWDPVPVAAP